MDKTTLVERDFVDGEILLKELDLNYMNVHSALWLYDSDADRWRFIIASTLKDSEGSAAAYTQIWNIIKQMEKTGVTLGFSLENISVISPNDSLIKNLSNSIQTGPKDIRGVRFSRTGIGSTFIDDAYVYRIQ
ncbi:hypothetical protein [Neobacillus sp. 19]|uniref:hypothetical protein n=1 Tax=Neobacillus sp. 19 TaxID=3394458 RepID=UPI003BF658EC